MIPGLGPSRVGHDQVVPHLVSMRVRRLLIVDEALPIRRKLLEILHRMGVSATDVEMATDAEHALETFARTHPTVVFTELVGLTTDEGLGMVLEMLRIDPQVKLILLTAEDPESAVVRQAVRAGVFAVVRKPLRHEAIRHLLSEIDSEEGGVERYR